jgi:Mce-associated membrane protein
MAKLKRDERVCPFCGENIKAVAIRCRFCHSEVTPVVEPEAQPKPKPESKTESTPPPAPKSRPVPPVVVEQVADPGAETSRPQAILAWLQRSLTLVLAVLVVLAAIGVGVSWWRSEKGSTTTAPNGALVGEDARTQVLVTAADLTQRTLSYSYKTLANDMEVARARMTPTFRKQYDSTMAQVRANTTKNKIVLQAVAASTAIIDATEHRAKVLVFVNQTTSAGTGKKQDQQLSRNSLVITLTRGDGDWAMSKLTALG